MVQEVIMGKTYQMAKNPAQQVIAVGYHQEDGALYFVNKLDSDGDRTFDYLAVERMALNEMS